MLICLLYFFCTFCVFVFLSIPSGHATRKRLGEMEDLLGRFDVFEVPDKCLFQVTFGAAENLGW